MDRLPLLRKMAEARPGDPFPRYGLAMELAKREDDPSLDQFARHIGASIVVSLPSCQPCVHECYLAATGHGVVAHAGGVENTDTESTPCVLS